MKLTFDGCGLNDAASPHKRRVATVSPDYRESGPWIASAASACHGMELPPGLPEGAVPDALAAARVLLKRAAGLDQSATHDGLENAAAIARLRAALEPFTPAAPPYRVSPWNADKKPA